MIEGSESADFGNTLLEAPDINIARVPQNGRTFEAYGEDPFLVARLSVANILGIQSQGIIANVKHYAANNQENGRRTVNVEVDERTLREMYLPAFEASVKEGHVYSLMGAYNKVNGPYCCENDVASQPDPEKGMGLRRLRDFRLRRGPQHRAVGAQRPGRGNAQRANSWARRSRPPSRAARCPSRSSTNTSSAASAR